MPDSTQQTVPVPEPVERITAARLARAYAAVFGQPGHRTPDQKLVMADIEAFGFAYRLVTEYDAHHSIDPHRSSFNDGRRSVWLRIRGQVSQADAPVQAAPKTTRQKPKT